MSIRTTVEILCDNKDCKQMEGGKPTFLRYIQEEARPEQLGKFVVFQMDNKMYTLCCRRCAAEFFLPLGLEIQSKKVVEFPKVALGRADIPGHGAPLSDIPVNGSLPQPDGDCT